MQVGARVQGLGLKAFVVAILGFVGLLEGRVLKYPK